MAKNQINFSKMVFVPSTGILYFYYTNPLILNTAEYRFSSPLRGSYISTYHSGISKGEINERFRPLYGDLIFLQYADCVIRALTKGFRPLYGDLIFLLLYQLHYKTKFLFSSPLRGSYISTLSLTTLAVAGKNTRFAGQTCKPDIFSFIFCFTTHKAWFLQYRGKI